MGLSTLTLAAGTDAAPIVPNRTKVEGLQQVEETTERPDACSGLRALAMRQALRTECLVLLPGADSKESSFVIRTKHIEFLSPWTISTR